MYSIWKGFWSGAVLPVFWKNNWATRETKCRTKLRGGGQSWGKKAKHWKGWGTSWLQRHCSDEGRSLNVLDHLSVVSEQPIPSSSQKCLSSSCPASSPDPATHNVYCTIHFPASLCGEALICKAVVSIQI